MSAKSYDQSREEFIEVMQGMVADSHRTGFLTGFRACLDYISGCTGIANPPEIVAEAMACAEKNYDRANREARGTARKGN